MLFPNRMLNILLDGFFRSIFQTLNLVLVPPSDLIVSWDSNALKLFMLSFIGFLVKKNWALLLGI